jgi:hypothetical protein
MDFVERWLGFSPDGGDGTFELVILAFVAAVAISAGVALCSRRVRKLLFARR